MDPAADRAGRSPAVPLLMAAVVLSFLAHAPFVLEGFGEGDAARLVNQAAGWHAAGELTIHEYTSRVSPLYLHALKALLSLGVPLRLMPAVVNWTNTVFGSLTLLPLYWLWEQIAGRRAAVAGIVLFWFGPAFWQAHIYGMPHLPSFAFFVTAAALFCDGLARPRRDAIPRFAGAAVLMVFAFGTKADVVLCALALPALALRQKEYRVRNVVTSVALVAGGLLSALLYSHLFVEPFGGWGVAEAGNWSQRFPFTIQAILDTGNRNRTPLAVGPVLFLVAVASVVVAAARRRHRGLLAVCLAWSAPAMLFWGLKMGNSPRHLMAAWSAVMLLAGAIAADVFRRNGALGAAVAVMVLANYFSANPNGDTLNPSPRLVASADRFDFRINRIHARSREFANLSATRKLVVSYTTNPWVLFETLASAREYSIRGHDLGLDVALVTQAGERQYVRAEHLWEKPGRVRARPGWVIWSFDKDVTVFDPADPGAPVRDSTEPPPTATLPLQKGTR